MKRAARLRTVCLAMAAVCCLMAVVSVGSLISPFLHPVAVSWRTTCVYVACEKSDVVVGDSVETSSQLSEERAAHVERLRARAGRPAVRAVLALGELVRVVPEVVFLLTLAIALRRLANGEIFERPTVRWLRRAAVAALWTVLADVAAFFIQSAALTPELTGNFAVYKVGDGVADGIVFASVAWVVAWALDQGVRTRDELAGYV